MWREIVGVSSRHTECLRAPNLVVSIAADEGWKLCALSDGNPKGSRRSTLGEESRLRVWFFVLLAFKLAGTCWGRNLGRNRQLHSIHRIYE